MTRSELLNAGMADADGLTALSIAAGRKHKELTEFLADLPEVDVNKASESGITPLLMVAEVGWTDVMRKLLKRSAHVDAAPRGKTAEEAKIAGSTPLIGATKYNNPEAVCYFTGLYKNSTRMIQYSVVYKKNEAVKSKYQKT